MKSAIQSPITWKNFAAQAAAVGGHENPQYMEHRWGRRRACRASVRVSGNGGVAGSGRLRDVSISGAFIETTAPLPLHSQLTVTVVDRDASHCGAEFTATVVRHVKDGVAIEWTEAASIPVCRMLGCTESCAFPAP